MREQEHNYEVVPIDNGFSVVPREEYRNIVTATLNKSGFWELPGRFEWVNVVEIPMFKFGELVSSVVDELYESWQEKKNNNIGYKIKKWAKEKTIRCLSKPIKKYWEKEINSFDNRLIVDVHKKCYSSSPNKGYWDNLKQIIKMENNKYILSDISKYRSAAISILYGDSTLIKDDWMLLYTGGEKKYQALTRTLMNIPGGVPPSLIYNGLSQITLPEAVKTRIRLFAYCVYGTRVWRKDDKPLSVIKNSTDEQIIEALRYMWRYFPESGAGDMRKTRVIINAFGRMFDYEGSWNNINILGLSKRSVEYHRNQELRTRIQMEAWERQRKDRELELEKLKLSKTKLPNISFPDDPCIKFLDTFVSVEKEGELMDHCIARYAEKAVSGDCYLFHVDYQGEMASVEVSPAGYVLQSYGPHDRLNKASEYGRLELNKWAKDMIKK